MAREGGADAGTPATTIAAADLEAVQDQVILDAQALADDFLGSGEVSITTVAQARAALTILRQAVAIAPVSAADRKAANTELDTLADILNGAFGSAEVKTGDFDTYAEINATVVGAVDLGNGVVLSGAMSVDAGTGYDFADDDSFDAAKTNGVAIDYVAIDAGAFGKLTIAPDDLEHLVDDDDDEAADLLYTNTVGGVSLSFAMDVDKDTNATARSSSFVEYAIGDDVSDVDYFQGTEVDDEVTVAGYGYTSAVAADVQWSAKIAAPVGDVATVYAAFDEEEGNAFGGTYTIEGITISVDSKLEALEKAEGEDRSNTIGVEYVAGPITVGGEWNSIEDGNQWAINGAYTDGVFSVAASTNEGEEWEVTGAVALTDAASAVAGVNYTEDAFVGVSFSF